MNSSSLTGPTHPLSSLRQRLTDLAGDSARLARLWRRLSLGLIVLGSAFAFFYYYDRYYVAVESPLDQAVASLEEAVRKNPNSPELRLQVANAYARQGQYERAITQYQEALKAKENWQPALLALASTEAARNNHREAEGIYRKVAELNRTSDYRYTSRDLGLVYYRLAQYAANAGRHDEAVNWAKDALRVNKTDADSLYLLGTSQEILGDPAAARASFKEATRYDPEFRLAFAALQRVAGTIGDRREAAYARAMELMASGDAENALTAFRRLIDESPDFAEAYQGLGLAYSKKGQRDEAAAAFRAAVERDPTLLLAQWGLRPPEGGR